jgi:hypothetical protein
MGTSPNAGASVEDLIMHNHDTIGIVFSELYPWVMEHDANAVIVVHRSEIEIAGSLRQGSLYGEAVVDVDGDVLSICKWSIPLADPECFAKLKQRIWLCLYETACTECKWIDGVVRGDKPVGLS